MSRTLCRTKRTGAWLGRRLPDTFRSIHPDRGERGGSDVVDDAIRGLCFGGAGPLPRRTKIRYELVQAGGRETLRDSGRSRCCASTKVHSGSTVDASGRWLPQPVHGLTRAWRAFSGSALVWPPFVTSRRFPGVKRRSHSGSSTLVFPNLAKSTRHRLPSMGSPQTRLPCTLPRSNPSASAIRVIAGHLVKLQTTTP